MSPNIETDTRLADIVTEHPDLARELEGLCHTR